MIYLTTGGNGAGKTLFTLRDVREQQLRESRPVYCHGFAAGEQLKAWGWQEFEPKRWQDLPDGSICIFDECQNEFPAKIQGELPEYINAVAQHRRRRGFDFRMVTPHPSLIHVNIRRLIESPSWHRHLKRSFGADMVSELKFNYAEVRCEQPGSGSGGQVAMRAFPKEVYGWYQSASLHTGKRKLPKQLWLLLAVLLLVPVLFWYAYRAVTDIGKKEPQADPAALAAQPASAAPARLSTQDYIAIHLPRLEGLPHTAPLYDELARPVRVPYPAACIGRGERCDCWTQQGTYIFMSQETCRHVMKDGLFRYWDTAERDKGDRDEPRRNAQASR